MINRNLDGCYFRVCRDGRWQSICFSDLTENERYDVVRGRSVAWLESLCCHLADCLRNIGDQLDIEFVDRYD